MKRNGKAADVRLHFSPQFEDKALRRLRQQLRQGERGDALDQSREQNAGEDKKERRFGEKIPARFVSKIVAADV